MKKFVTVLISLFFLTCCQSTKDAFSLKKKSSTDEFLVEKKSPLVLPPNFGKLPTPNDGSLTNDKKEDEIKVLVGKDNKISSSSENDVTGSKSLEKSILDKIK
tara:strand:+ start:456 stop:764 length:309 start_codon:yes stop_codon:yes gene_type:complete